MPTLDEIRAWARGLFIPGLPRPEDARVPEEPEAPKGGIRTDTYKINSDGTDALLKFGKHRGRTVSWLAVERPDYLQWMLSSGGRGRVDRQPFDEELLDVVRYRLEGARE
jgi:hypothetical protein